jgi:hypothetical protein
VDDVLIFGRRFGNIPGRFFHGQFHGLEPFLALRILPIAHTNQSVAALAHDWLMNFFAPRWPGRIVGLM